MTSHESWIGDVASRAGTVTELRARVWAGNFNGCGCSRCAVRRQFGQRKAESSTALCAWVSAKNSSASRTTGSLPHAMANVSAFSKASRAG